MGRYINRKLPTNLISNIFRIHECLSFSQKKLIAPPVFLIGVPRSGTTMLYQLLCERFYWAYFTNISNLFPYSPVTITAIFKKYLYSYKECFRSEYGVSNGWFAPSEAGDIWNRWFPHEKWNGSNFADENTLTISQEIQIQKVLVGLESIFRAPFLNKNTKMSVRIRSIVKVFPDALFIHICRDPLDTAISILRAREINCRSINDWWSVMPPNGKKLLNKDFDEQICGQIFYLNEEIDKSKKNIGGKRFLTLSYESICQNPELNLQIIKKFCSENGCFLSSRNTVPVKFTCNKENIIKKDPNINKLMKALRNYDLL